MLPASSVRVTEGGRTSAPGQVTLSSLTFDLPSNMGLPEGGSDQCTPDEQSNQSAKLRQDHLLANLDIPHRGSIVAKKGAPVEFKATRGYGSQRTGKKGRKRDTSKKRKGKNEVVLQKSPLEEQSGEASVSRGRSPLQQSYIHPWGPEAQGLPEVNTLAGDTAALTKSWNKSESSLTQKRSKGKKSTKPKQRSPSSVLSSIFRLEEEEVEEDFQTHNIRQGIETARRAPPKAIGWKTPYEIDAPRSVLLAKPSPPTSSSSGGSSKTSEEASGLDAEKKLWDGIEALIADAFSDDDSRSHLSALADIFPSHVLRALGERSLAGDSIFSSSKGSSHTTPSTGKRKVATAEVAPPDEIEAAQLALNSFMDLLLPNNGDKHSSTAQSKSTGAYPDSSLPSLQENESMEGEEEADEISLAEVALNNFMDVLLSDLERDLSVDPVHMTHEQLLEQRRKAHSTLTLFEVFRWSLQVDIDSLEKMKYIRSHPEIQEQIRENRRRAEERQASRLAEGLDSPLSPQRPLQLFTPRTMSTHSVSARRLSKESEEKRDKDIYNSQQQQDTTGDFQFSKTKQERPQVERIPSWAAIGGLPIVMAPKRTPSQRSSPLSQRTSLHSQGDSRRSGSVGSSSSSGGLPSSFVEGEYSKDVQSLDSQGSYFPFEVKDEAAHTVSQKQPPKKPVSPPIVGSGDVVAELESIASEESLLSNMGLLSISSSTSGIPALASISEYSVPRLAELAYDTSATETKELSLSQHLEGLRPAPEGTVSETNAGAIDRTIRRTLSDEVSHHDSCRIAFNEFVQVEVRSQTDVISVGSAGDVHMLVGSTLHVVHRDGDQSNSSADHPDDITMDSELRADASRSIEHGTVPKFNQNYGKRGRRRLPFGGRVVDGIKNARERGKCFRRNWCTCLCPGRYTPLQPSEHGVISPLQDDESDENSRACLLHGMDKKYEQLPLNEQGMSESS